MTKLLRLRKSNGRPTKCMRNGGFWFKVKVLSFKMRFCNGDSDAQLTPTTAHAQTLAVMLIAIANMFDWIRNIFNKDDNKRIKIRFELDNGDYYEELVKADDFDQRLNELEKELNPRKPLSEIEFIWCLIGNIIDEHYSETEKKIEYGTKHFSPNTKVYCFPGQWGDGYENIKVIGRHRKTSRNVCIIMRSRLITNWRLQKVYRPYILKVMHSQNGWRDNDKDKETILEMIKWLPDRTKEMKSE